jgi:glycerophosphoryl diester phosphodiesterase
MTMRIAGRTAWSASVARLLCTLLLSISVESSALDLQGHRGGRGLMPENTLASFANALRIGVTTLELDIAITDQAPVKNTSNSDCR